MTRQDYTLLDAAAELPRLGYDIARTIKAFDRFWDRLPPELAGRIRTAVPAVDGLDAEIGVRLMVLAEEFEAEIGRLPAAEYAAMDAKVTDRERRARTPTMKAARLEDLQETAENMVAQFRPPSPVLDALYDAMVRVQPTQRDFGDENDTPPEAA